ALYGIPLLAILVARGIPMPAVAEQAGYAIGERIYPTYSAALVVGTTALVGAVTTIVSYLPTRKIAALQPTEALRGRQRFSRPRRCGAGSDDRLSDQGTPARPHEEPVPRGNGDRRRDADGVPADLP